MFKLPLSLIVTSAKYDSVHFRLSITQRMSRRLTCRIFKNLTLSPEIIHTHNSRKQTETYAELSKLKSEQPEWHCIIVHFTWQPHSLYMFIIQST